MIIQKLGLKFWKFFLLQSSNNSLYYILPKYWSIINWKTILKRIIGPSPLIVWETLIWKLVIVFIVLDVLYGWKILFFLLCILFNLNLWWLCVSFPCGIACYEKLQHFDDREQQRLITCSCWLHYQLWLRPKCQNLSRIKGGGLVPVWDMLISWQRNSNGGNLLCLQKLQLRSEWQMWFALDISLTK